MSHSRKYRERETEKCVCVFQDRKHSRDVGTFHDQGRDRAYTISDLPRRDFRRPQFYQTATRRDVSDPDEPRGRGRLQHRKTLGSLHRARE